MGKTSPIRNQLRHDPQFEMRYAVMRVKGNSYVGELYSKVRTVLTYLTLAHVLC